MTGARLPWCVVDRASPESARVAEALTRAWGPGLGYLWGVPWVPDRPAVLPPAAIARILEGAATAWWWSDGATLDVGRVAEAVAHGCVPVQAMPAAAAARVHAGLLADCHPLVVAFDATALPPPPDDATLRARLDAARRCTGSDER